MVARGGGGRSRWWSSDGGSSYGSGDGRGGGGYDSGYAGRGNSFGGRNSTNGAQLESGKTVLVMAAAGGTGQIAVQVLKKGFPKGVDIVYESVGGDMFGMCFISLADYG
ncbi:alcohol dehydrogenase [Tanacetum coccineum]